MITLLSKIFIKNKYEEESQRRKAYGTLCSIAGIMLNILLFAGKYFAGFISGSIAIMADAFNNLSDAGSSFMTLVGFWFAGKKPDVDHPFGHGRFEYISGLGVAVMIILMGVELVKSSISKIIHPEPVESGMIIIVILLVSIAVKLYMAIYNRNIGKKIDSSAMKATSADSMSDMIATSAVLLCVIINRIWGLNLDGICGLVVSLVILYAGYGVVKDTISPLLGQPPSEEFVESIYNIVMAHEEINGIHDLVVHDYGPGRVMISLHTEVPGDGDIFAIHDVIDRIENELHEQLGCEAVIHMDPIETNNEVVQQMRQIVDSIVKEISKEISIHDFRMVTGDTHTNLIFDVVIPYSINEKDDIIKERIQEKITEYNDKYYAVMHVDREYIYSINKLISNDLSKAKERLMKENLTCVFCKDEQCYTSNMRGVKPILEHVEKNDVVGFSVADKVVGKASAYLYILLKVRAVYAAVITEKAIELFNQYGIIVEYDSVVDYIKNRTNTGMCPMEEATLNVNSPDEALKAVVNRLEELNVDKR